MDNEKLSIMKTQHTPGPWKVRERGSQNHQDNGSFVSVMPDLDGSEKWHAYNICSIYSPMDTKNSAYHPTQEQLANARLIAAAPELLEALQELKQWVMVNDYSLVALQKAERVITKATTKP